MIFFSNRLEILFEHLKRNLYENSTPFSKRLLIVPSRAMEEWIRLKIADDATVQIACGLSSSFLNQALSTLSHPLPSQLELTLGIEREIRRILEAEREEKLWLPMVSYLEGKEQRLMPLCKELARLFIRYGIYGRRLPQKHWQMQLWNRLFAAKDFQFTSKKTAYGVHLFAFSHLASRHFDFFCRLGKCSPVFFYHLSPCQEFWSDILPDRHSESDHFEEKHPLLANLGRIGREFARLVEESECETVEAYFSPGGDTQLTRLQDDLLFLRNPSSSSPDGSIQIHHAPTRLREIQILHETIRDLIAEKGIEPKDVLVMAPDIALYEPLIRAVFTKELDYQIADMQAETKNEHVKGLFQLLDLEKERWSAPALLALFESPLFRQRIGWDGEDLFQIRKWIGEAEIHWGLDHAHQNRLLGYCGRPLQEGGGSWADGFDRLLKRLASAEWGSPLDFTQAELLGELIKTLRSLREDLNFFESEKSLSEWSLLLKQLNARYFGGDEDNRNVLLSALSQLSLFHKFDEETYPFSILSSVLEELFEERVTLRKNRLQTVRFCSLLPMRAIPSRVICLLGMNHDAFPRKELRPALDLLAETENQDYCPSRLDFDRYLFLEALLSARDTLWISHTETPLSTVVLELLTAVGEVKRVDHPEHGFDPAYFDGARPELNSYSEADYLTAKRMIEPATSPEFFSFASPSKENSPPEGDLDVDLNDLLRFAKYPIQYFYQKSLGLYFQREEELRREEDFLLSPFKKTRIESASLRDCLDEIIEKEKKRGGYPLGAFGKLATLRLRRSAEEVLEGETLELPPLVCLYDEKRTLYIRGVIEGVSPKGLLVQEKCTLKGIARLWPLFLVLNCIRPTPLFFAKEGVLKEPPFEDAKECLKRYLEYYFSSLIHPSPLLPDWVEPILKRNARDLEKRIAQSLSSGFGRSYDKGLRWALRGNTPPSAERIIEAWNQPAQNLFGVALNAWF